MESAIPSRLTLDRTEPVRMRTGWTPPSPAFSARFDDDVDTVVMAYLGLQYRGSTAPAVATEAVAALRERATRADGPAHRDAARYVDSSGYTNDLNILYWTDFGAYQRWSEDNLDWTDQTCHTSDEVGFFLEIATPSFDRFETIFGGRKMEGASVLSSGISEEIAEHGYWGSARDRFPAAQTDPLTPVGSLGFAYDGDLVIVTPHENMCLIRSGQDWAKTVDEPRERYVGTIEPVLAAGMKYLEDEGRTIGCYGNRYVSVVDDDGAELSKSYGTSWWHSLAELEKWSKSHPTHLKIFGTFGQYVKEFGGAVGLRLYHEVTVVAADQARFEYLRCHPRTGLLNAGAPRSAGTESADPEAESVGG